LGVLDALACHFQTKETYGACINRRAEESFKKDEQTAKDAGAKEMSVGTKVAVDAKTNIEAHNTSLEQSLNIY
jgi:hypothetical protein